jgi:phosphinothricin acetyltransferase
LDGADLILGYAYLSPFRGHLLSYAPTVEMSIFMRTDQRSFGYGTLLLKKLLGLVATGHIEHRCEERVGDIARIGPGSALGVVNTSPVRNVIAIMAFDPENPVEGTRLRDWYVKWGFIQNGQLHSVGKKMGHW